MIKNLEMVVFDMSGTTVTDYNEVLDCFYDALVITGIERPKSYINTMMGWSKIEVFETLWREEIGYESGSIKSKAQESFKVFKKLLETWYETHDIHPTEGCIETFNYLRSEGIKITLNTGFYREVVDIILQKLDWKVGRDIDFSIASDEVAKGRPEPFMIQKAMQHFNIYDALKVAKIGDTPSDIQEGKAVGCHSFAVTNGTHRHEELVKYNADALFGSLKEFLAFLKSQKMMAVSQ